MVIFQNSYEQIIAEKYGQKIMLQGEYIMLIGTDTKEERMKQEIGMATLADNDIDQVMQQSEVYMYLIDDMKIDMLIYVL